MSETHLIEGDALKVPDKPQNHAPSSDQHSMLASPYNIIGQIHDEKGPNNDIRLLSKPKQIRLV